MSTSPSSSGKMRKYSSQRDDLPCRSASSSCAQLEHITHRACGRTTFPARRALHLDIHSSFSIYHPSYHKTLAFPPSLSYTRSYDRPPPCVPRWRGWTPLPPLNLFLRSFLHFYHTHTLISTAAMSKGGSYDQKQTPPFHTQTLDLYPLFYLSPLIISHFASRSGEPPHAPKNTSSASCHFFQQVRHIFHPLPTPARPDHPTNGQLALGEASPDDWHHAPRWRSRLW
jgi:hypothetical protein